MKLITPILLLLIVSCNSNDIKVKDSPLLWSENQKRQYFKDSIAYRNYNGRHTELTNTLNNADTFFLKAFNIKTDFFSNNCILYALEESFMDTTELDSNINILRITVNPTFQIPYGIILKQSKTINTLTGKMTDGHGGYFSGYLDLAVTQKVDSVFINQIFQQLDSMNFNRLPSKIEVDGADGETWRIELLKNGQYHSITRWSPVFVGDSITRKIGKLGNELRDTCKLFEYWALQSDSSKAFKEYILKSN